MQKTYRVVAHPVRNSFDSAFEIGLVPETGCLIGAC